MGTYECTGCGFKTRDNEFLKHHICIEEEKIIYKTEVKNEN